jgi:hypothetical protein
MKPEYFIYAYSISLSFYVYLYTYILKCNFSDCWSNNHLVHAYMYIQRHVSFTQGHHQEFMSEYLCKFAVLYCNNIPREVCTSESLLL